MNILTTLLRITLLLSLWAWPALAYQVFIKADYSPVTDENQSFQFTDTTPCFGYWCQFWGNKKILQINTFINRSFLRGSDPRQQVYLRFPGSSYVTVQNEQGHTAHLIFTLTDVGGVYRRNSDKLPHLYYFANDLTFADPGSPCGPSSFSTHNGKTDTVFLWSINEQAQRNGGTCTRSIRTNYSGYYGYTKRHLTFSYRLTTPDPLKLASGTYKGKRVFSVGPNADFDFGAGQYADSEIIFDFELKVNHQSRFYFPPGSEHAVLEPEDGWAGYLKNGKFPESVTKSLPFQLWNSVPLSIYLQCQYQSDSDCALENAQHSHSIPVHTSLSLPGQLSLQNGSTIDKLRLRSGAANSISVQINSPVTKGDGTLHFSVQRQALQGIPEQYKTDLYKGDVTLIIEPHFP